MASQYKQSHGIAIKILSVKSDSLLKIFGLHSFGDNVTLYPQFSKYRISCMKISPDGNYLFTGHYKTVKQWNLKNGKLVYHYDGYEFYGQKQTNGISSSYITCIDISNSSKYLLTYSDDGILIKWNLETKQVIDILDEISITQMCLCSKKEMVLENLVENFPTKLLKTE